MIVFVSFGFLRLTSEIHENSKPRLYLNVRPNILLQCFTINEIGSRNILNRDAHGLVERNLISAASARFGSGEHLADLAINRVLRNGVFREGEQNIAALGHDRVAGVNY